MGDQSTAIEYIKQRLNYCVNAMKNEFNLRLMPSFRNNTILQNSMAGAWTETLQDQPAQPGTRAGILLQMYDTSSFYDLQLSSIGLWTTNYTGNVTIKVHNLVTGVELDSFDIAVVANQPSFIQINKRYTADRQRTFFYISYLTTGINSVQSSITGYTTGCSTCGTRSGFATRFGSINSATLDNSASPVFENLSYPGNTAGLSLQYSLNCSVESFFCSLKNQMAWSLLHRFGQDICEEVINGSKRVNSVTTLDKEKATALKEDYEGIYVESFNDLFQRVRLPNDTCFKCNQAVKTRVRIP